MFWSRDLKRWRWVAVAQIFAAATAGVTALLTIEETVAKWVGFAGAVFAVANGLQRLWTIHNELRVFSGGNQQD
jgi:hypothetical protein